MKYNQSTDFIPFALLWSENLYASINKASKLRFNNAVLKDIDNAGIYTNGSFINRYGELGILIKKNIHYIDNKSEIDNLLLDKLQSKDTSIRNYVLNCYSDYMFNTKHPLFSDTCIIIQERLKKFDKEFYDKIALLIECGELTIEQNNDLIELFNSINKNALLLYEAKDELPF
jgi:hypothetical protein